jgi:hypothetical protein
VQPVPWVRFAVACDQTGCDGLCSTHMVRGICRVCGMSVGVMVLVGGLLRRTMSAAALSRLSRAESSRSPITTRTFGYWALICSAFSVLRTNA